MKQRALAFALLIGLGACGGPRPETVPEPAPTPVEEAGAAVSPDDVSPWTSVAEAMADVHEREKVDAEPLEIREFQPEAYWEILEPIVTGAPELFRLTEIGRSVEGRPLRRIDFGRGDTTVLLWSQMHGNESTASRSLVDLVAWLSDHRDDPRVRRIESSLSLTLVPVVNPDGAARFLRHNAVGIDLNRDARVLATPEARTLKAVRDDIDADWGFNLHDQNVRTRLGSSGRDVLIALLAPPPGPGETSPENRRARRMCSLLSAALAPVVGDQIARYDESFNPRAFGDLMAAWGTSTVLIESGGELSDPHKSRLRRANFVALVTALDAIATGDWETFGEDLYFDLPLNAPWIHDVLVRGATVLLPDAQPVRADLAIDFNDSLLGNAGRIVEVGDLADLSALTEIDATGLYYLPDPGTLDAGGLLAVGTTASGVLARDQAGEQRVWILRQGRPERVE